MRIEARVPLHLPKVVTKVTVTYNAYEQATYDVYLAASIVVNAISESDIERYIDDITGKGSLNKHLKKRIEEIQKMDDSTRKKILDYSIFPITKIDKTNRFVYYPYFDVSELRGKVIKGNLKDFSYDELKKRLNIDGDNIKFEFEENNDSREDQYPVRLEDNNLSVNINRQDWLTLTSSQFEKAYKSSLSGIERYNGVIKDSGEGDHWRVLTDNVLNNLVNDKCCYIDNNGNHCSVKDYLEVTQIINVFGLFLYKKKQYDYTSQNINKCQRVVEHLFQSQQLFDFAKQPLLSLTNSVNDKTKQNIINYILTRREDPEMAEIGIDVLSRITHDWEREALMSMKKASRQSLTNFYRINPDLDYTDMELSRIDKKILSQEDLERRDKYISNRKSKITEIRGIVGEITASGIRQRMKNLYKNETTKILTKELNAHIGHKEDDIIKYSDEQLDQYLTVVREMYKHYQEVLKMITSNDANK